MFALKIQKLEHIGGSSPNAQIIHAFKLDKKDFQAIRANGLQVQMVFNANGLHVDH